LRGRDLSLVENTGEEALELEAMGERCGMLTAMTERRRQRGFRSGRAQASRLSDECVLGSEHLPDTMSPLQDVLEVVVEHASGIRRTARWELADARQLGIEINHHERGSQHPNASESPGDVAPFEDAGPQLDVLLHDRRLATADPARWIDQFGVGPIVLAVGRPVGVIPRVHESIHHGLGRSRRLLWHRRGLLGVDRGNRG
jgi:hypothetical protein